MKTRTLIATLIFLFLSAVKFLLPEKTSQIRDFLVPAISREVSLRDDIIELGRAISGGGNYVYVWERWIGRKSDDSEKIKQSPVQDSPKPSPSSEGLEGFKLTKMIRQNLIGFESFAELPLDENTKSEDQSVPTTTGQPSPSAPAESATPEKISENELNKETAAVNDTSSESSLPVAVSEQSAKVDEFLREQSAFADYALPSNVSYDSPVLPFEYTQPVVSTVTSGFGYRLHPIDGVVKFHYGSDFGVVDGSDISAFADGTVISAQEFDGYGMTIILDHGNDFTTLYAHCSQLLVKMGDKVKGGDKIALSGHSGRVTGPHMHFELMKNKVYLNPEFYF